MCVCEGELCVAEGRLYIGSSVHQKFRTEAEKDMIIGQWLQAEK